MVRRHRVQIDSSDIKDSSIATLDISDGAVQEGKFGIHREHGTVASVTATGRYKTFSSAFGTPPDVVVTGFNSNARLAGTPVAGSFKAELDAAGTSDAMFVAWGSR